MSQRGFTLIELLVGVVILGVLASVASSVAPDRSAQALSLAELTLGDALDTARASAITTRVPHGVSFDPTGERFAVLARDGVPVEHPLHHGPYVVDLSGPGHPPGLDLLLADFGVTGFAAVFDGQGLPMSGGSVTVSHGGQTRTLLLDAATGYWSSSP